MEKSRMQEWDLESSDLIYDEGFLDFGLEGTCWNDLVLDQKRSLIPLSEVLMEKISDFTQRAPESEFSPMEEDLVEKIVDCEDAISLSHHYPTEAEDSCAGNKSISSETTSVDCDCRHAPALIPDSEEYKGLCLVHLLTACAEAISDGAHDLVEIILCRLKELVSATGSTMQRVAYYLSQSLHRRHHCEENICNVSKHPNYLGAFSLLNQVYPYIRFAHFTANQSILEAIPIQTQKAVHIIDFDIMEGMQWPPLMEALMTENYKIGLLKITAVKWYGDDDPGPWKHTGRRLCEYANSVGIPFSFQETHLENVKSNMAEEEIVIVNCMWGLPHMFERGRKQVLQFIEGTRSLNPAILTVGSGPNGIESHQNLRFLEHFGHCLKNLCAVFDSLEAGLAEEYGLARAMVERLFMGPIMCRPIFYMPEEEDGLLTSVVDIPLKCGFPQGDISETNILYAKCMVEEARYYRVELGGQNQLVLRWHSTPLTCISTWKGEDRG